jgi:hypothetical protein
MKRAFAIVVAAAAILTGFQTYARAMSATRVVPVAPGGADYIGASNDVLAAHGFPPRPVAPFDSDRYQRWMRVMRAARVPLDVQFIPMQQLTPLRVFQPDWAGAVLFAPGAQPMRIPQYRFSEVEAEWTVPVAKPTINCSNRWEPSDGSSLWVGLDGWMSTFVAHAKGKDGKYHTYDSTDVLQAGSESDVACYSGGPIGNYPTSSYFWIEWAGTKNIAVRRNSRNLPVRAGDTIYVRIAAETKGPAAWQRATLWFVNETTGYYLPARTFHSGCVDCGTPYQRPATLFGDTVEWMAEATFYSAEKKSLPNTLDDFGNVAMAGAYATDQDGTLYSPEQPGAATANIDWMTWQGTPLAQGGTLLACSAIEGPSTVTVARAPYVIATPGQQGQLEPKPQRCR